MKPIFTIAFIAYASVCFSQQVINSTGKSFSNIYLILEYSVGEIATTTSIGSQQIISQGLLQVETTGTNELFDTKFSIRCFPNPTTTELIIETDFLEFQRASIYSIDGKLIFQQPFDYQNIQVGILPSGIYFLKLTDDQNLYSKTIKISKQ